jgi:hypothetical protein
MMREGPSNVHYLAALRICIVTFHTWIAETKLDMKI